MHFNYPFNFDHTTTFHPDTLQTHSSRLVVSYHTATVVKGNPVHITVQTAVAHVDTLRKRTSAAVSARAVVDIPTRVMVPDIKIGYSCSMAMDSLDSAAIGQKAKNQNPLLAVCSKKCYEHAGKI